jgi:hypothetical protein
MIRNNFQIIEQKKVPNKIPKKRKSKPKFLPCSSSSKLTSIYLELVITTFQIKISNGNENK